jgi:hypothetical protein
MTSAPNEAQYVHCPHWADGDSNEHFDESGGARGVTWTSATAVAVVSSTNRGTSDSARSRVRRIEVPLVTGPYPTRDPSSDRDAHR